jgi:predicted O-linked N-acetylglucosamine transferase (SPINDLY family)
VLTLTGHAFAGRVAASLLRAIDLPELITSTAGQYEDLAVELATNPSQLARIRRKLSANRLSTPLFDTQSFTKNLESAYRRICERYRANLPPEHIYPEV